MYKTCTQSSGITALKCIFSKRINVKCSQGHQDLSYRTMANKYRLFFLRSSQQVLRCVHSTRSVPSMNQIYSTKPSLPPNSLARAYEFSRTCSTYTSGNVTLNKTLYLLLAIFKSYFLLLVGQSSFSQRSHKCGELCSSHINEEVTLFGWIQYLRFVCMLVSITEYKKGSCTVLSKNRTFFSLTISQFYSSIQTFFLLSTIFGKSFRLVTKK